MPLEERLAVRHAFDGAAASYDAAATVQRAVAGRLLQHAMHDLRRARAGWILDAGCGTGQGMRALQAAGTRPVIALDFAPGMLRRCPPGPAVCADIEALPLPAGSVSLYWSSLAWQWTDPVRAMAEAARVLMPGAALHVATLGPETLCELRDAFAGLDDARHVRDFPDPDRYPHWLEAAGLGSIRVQRERFRAWEPDVLGVLRGLRKVGAHHVGTRSRRGLLGRGSWRALESRYEAWRTEHGLPATYDAIFLSAVRQPDPSPYPDER